MQATPPVPHVDRVPGERQVVPLQQPSKQLVASHTHWLLKQRCPVEHAGPVPHRQLPVPQLFATVGSHAVHAAPWVPHALGDGADTQVVP